VDIEAQVRHPTARGTACGRPRFIDFASGRQRASEQEAAKRLALQVLPTDPGYGVGFIGAHDARGGCYAFVDWWTNENELHHKSFLGPSPDELRPAGPNDSAACVWDLAVIDFERRAWHELVLKRADAPGVEAYLARQLDATV